MNRLCVGSLVAPLLLAAAVATPAARVQRTAASRGFSGRPGGNGPPRRPARRRAACRAPDAQPRQRGRRPLQGRPPPDARGPDSHQPGNAAGRAVAGEVLEGLAGRPAVHGVSPPGHPVLRRSPVRCRRCGVLVSRLPRRKGGVAVPGSAHRRREADCGAKAGSADGAVRSERAVRLGRTPLRQRCDAAAASARKAVRRRPAERDVERDHRRGRRSQASGRIDSSNSWPASVSSSKGTRSIGRSIAPGRTCRISTRSSSRSFRMPTRRPCGFSRGKRTSRRG